MAISRMQEPQQLTGVMSVKRVPAAFGGIMDNTTGRRAYGLGSIFKKITRPIKKAVKGVKKIAKSPIGRLALLYAGGAALGGSTALGGAGGSFFSRLANPGNLANLSNIFGNKALGLQGISGVGGQGLGRFLNPFNKANPLFFKEGAFNLGRAGITASALGAALPFLAPGLLAPEQEEEEIVDIVNTPGSIAALNQRARDFYNYGDENLLYMPRKQYVMRNFYAKDGGRVGFDNGGLGALGRMMQPGKSKSKDLDIMTIKATLNQVYTNNDDGEGAGYEAVMEFMEKNPEYKVNIMENIIGDRGDKIMVAPIEKEPVNILDNMDTSNMSLKDGVIIINNDMLEKKAEGGSVPESKVKGYDTPAGFNKFDYPTGGVPVRTPKKQGGLMNLGGLEMDFRAEGGFVPIGAKEKADDVPARLSKNEFVMTADAVRGAGNGSIKAGAQKMYNTMKELENRVV